MKKLSSIAIVAMFAALVFSSCKKDYTCSCAFHDSSGYFADTTYSYPINDVKKDDAETACQAHDISSGTVSYNCTID